MSISSTSLFHFTRKFEWLQSIVQEGFEFRESTEELPLRGYDSCIFDRLGLTVTQHAPRIVCFCDLPQSQSENHRSQYGQYAIALSKEWGIRNGVTPIRYVHAQTRGFDSDFYNMALDLPDALARDGVDMHGMAANLLRSMQGAPAPTEEEIEALSPGVKQMMSCVNHNYLTLLKEVRNLLAFVRIYEGEWVDRATNAETQRLFYEEREWRAAAFEDEGNLKFDIADVNYFIVTTKEEQTTLTKQLLSGENETDLGKIQDVCSKIRVSSEVFGDA